MTAERRRRRLIPWPGLAGSGPLPQHSRQRVALAFAASLVATGAIAAGALGAPGDGILDTTLVSRASGAGGAVGDGSSRAPSISDDGRLVAFQSGADNLDPDSNDAADDVFVRDLQTGAITLVSRATGAAGAVGDGFSSDPSISADGSFVAFQSDADNLDPDSNDAVTDVFVRDLLSNTTTLVSRATGAAGAVGDLSSNVPSISGNGRLVAFHSAAGNLDLDSNDAVIDVYVRDVQANTTVLVSRAAGAAGAVGDGSSSFPGISDDGRHVAFQSSADNLDSDSNDAVTDVFVRDTATLATTLVSRATGAAGVAGDGNSSTPAKLSAEGRFITFSSDSGNLDADSDDTVSDVFARDTHAAATTLLSRATGAAGPVGDGDSFGATLTPDARLVGFISEADNLDPDSNDAVDDVFVRDLQAAATTLVSRATGAAGAAGDGISFNPSVSADGRLVAFQSGSTNLDPESNDGFNDVFVRELVDPLVAPPQPSIQPPASTPPPAKQVKRKCKKAKKRSAAAPRKRCKKRKRRS